MPTHPELRLRRREQTIAIFEFFRFFPLEREDDEDPSPQNLPNRAIDKPYVCMYVCMYETHFLH